MTPEDEIRRGGDAARLLRDAIYNEAHTAIRDRIVSQLSQAETTGEKRERLNNLLIALETVKRYMEQIAIGGKMAADQIERDRTFRERVGDRIRSIA
jgi:hypothetical protein